MPDMEKVRQVYLTQLEQLQQTGDLLESELKHAEEAVERLGGRLNGVREEIEFIKEDIRREFPD